MCILLSLDFPVSHSFVQGGNGYLQPYFVNDTCCIKTFKLIFNWKTAAFYFFNIAIGSSYFSCLQLFATFLSNKIYLSRIFTVLLPKPIFFPPFYLPSVEAFSLCRFYDLGRSFSSLSISVDSEELWGQGKDSDAGHKSQFEWKARDRVQRGDFLLFHDFIGPISVLCQTGRKPPNASRSGETHFFFSDHILIRGEWHPAKNIPKHKALALRLSYQWSFPSNLKCSQPQREVPLCTGLKLLPSCGHNSGIDPHLFPTTESSTVH